MVKPISEDEFWLIKKRMEENPDANAWAIGYASGRGIAKISIIAACKDFDEYERIKKAEHPPVKHSLRDEIEDIKRRLDTLEGSQQDGYKVQVRTGKPRVV